MTCGALCLKCPCVDLLTATLPQIPRRTDCHCRRLLPGGETFFTASGSHIGLKIGPGGGDLDLECDEKAIWSHAMGLLGRGVLIKESTISPVCGAPKLPVQIPQGAGIVQKPLSRSQTPQTSACHFPCAACLKVNEFSLLLDAGAGVTRCVLSRVSGRCVASRRHDVTTLRGRHVRGNATCDACSRTAADLQTSRADFGGALLPQTVREYADVDTDVCA